MKTIFINSKKLGRKECLVDDDDFDFLNQWKWKLLVSYNSIYAVRNVDIRDERGNKRSIVILMHREVLKLTDNNMLVEHLDLNGLNNQKANLRTCNKSQNNSHRKSAVGSSSKYLGVTWDKNRNK